MTDVFDTLTVKKKDIFDTIEPRDIFDEVSTGAQHVTAVVDDWRRRGKGGFKGLPEPTSEFRELRYALGGPFTESGKRQTEGQKDKGRIWTDIELEDAKVQMQQFPDQFTTKERTSLERAEAAAHPFRALPSQIKTVITKGISQPFGWGEFIAPGLKEELKQQLDAIPGIVGPTAAATTAEGIDTFIKLKFVFPFLFKAAGLPLKLAPAKKAATILKKATGLNKLADLGPTGARIERLVSTSFGAGIKGAEVGALYTGVTAYAEGMSLDEAKPLIMKNAALMAGMATAFNVAGFIDTQVYRTRLKSALLKALNAKYRNLHAEIQTKIPDYVVKDGKRLLNTAKGKAIKGAASSKRLDLHRIDKIVAEAEATLIGAKKGKLFPGQRKYVESPTVAAKRFMAEPAGAQIMVRGAPRLETGMGVSKQRDILTGEVVGRGRARPIPKPVSETAKVAPVAKPPAEAPIIPPKAPEAGKALEVFHGGSPEIVGKPLVEFADKGDIRGVFFTEDKDVAEQFAKEQVGEHGKVSRYRVTLENPATNEIVDAKIKEGRELGYKEPHLGDWVTDELLAEGYDGAIRETGYGNEIIAFTNEAIAPPKAPEAKVAKVAPTAKEPGEAEMAVTETGISERDRRTRVKAVEEQIRQHELYQDAVDVEEERTRAIGTGFYYIPPSHKSEVYDIIGYPKKGRETALQKMFTFELGTGAQSYDQAVQEALARYTPEGEDTSGTMDVAEFVQRVKETHEAKKGRKAFNERALAAALETGEPTLELLKDIRWGLQAGKTIGEINANTIEFAEFYDLTKEDVSDYIIPEYTDEQRAKEIKAARPKDEKLEAVAGKRQAKEAEERRQRSAEMKRIQEEEKLRKMAEQARLQKQGELEKQAHRIAAEKGLIGPRGKPTQNYTRFAKAMTGKPRVEKMTVEEAEHFIDMLEALTVGYKGRAKIPTSKHLITKELADKIGKFTDIGFAERFRPAWRVFEKIGIRKEIFDPTLESEIKSTEELFAFREKAKELQKLVGADKETSRRLFRAMENPGKIKLNENEQKVIKWGQRFFQDWARRLNLSSEKQRKNYVTHIFEREITEDLKKKYPLDPDLVKALEFITPKTVFNPFLQKRLGKKIGLKEDFWAAIEAYEGRALKSFYYEPLIKRLRVYQKFLPPNAARYLRNYIARITNRPTIVDREVNQTLKEVGKEIEKMPGGKNLAKYLQRGNASGMLAYNMTGIMYEGWLGLRPASAIKNLTQHGLILAETGPVAFVRAMKTKGEERASLLERSLVLRSRKLGYLPGIDQTFIKSLESKRRKITMAMFRAADRKNVSDAFLAGYHEAKAKGLPDEWAYKRGDEVAAKTQWLYNKMAGAQFMQTGPGKVLGALTTWPENWAELMNDWIQAKPSSVYTDYTKLTGRKIEPTNWIARRKALWTYLALVSLAMLIHKKTPFRAMYYTGWTSLASLAKIARGELAGLQIPAIIADIVAGLLTLDKRRLKRAWNEIKKWPVIQKELRDIITGKKDWINLFVYMEKEKESSAVRSGGRAGGRSGGRSGGR